MITNMKWNDDNDSNENSQKVVWPETVPTEIWSLIFSYLDTKSLCRIAQVNKQWHDLANDQLIWKKKCQQHSIKQTEMIQRQMYNLNNKSINQKKVIEVNDWKLRFAATFQTQNIWFKAPFMYASVAAHDHGLASVQIHGQYIIAAGWDHALTVWKVLLEHSNQATLQLHCTLLFRKSNAHLNLIHRLAVKGDYILTGSKGVVENLKIWSLTTGELLSTLPGHLNTLMAACFIGETQIATMCSDGVIQVWEMIKLSNGLTVQLQKTFQVPVDNDSVIDMRIVYSEKENIRIRALTQNGTVYDYFLNQRLPCTSASMRTPRLAGMQEQCSLRKLSESGCYISSGFDSGRVVIKSLSLENKNIKENSQLGLNPMFDSHYDWITDAMVFEEVDIALTSSWDGSILIWDTKSKKAQRRISAPVNSGFLSLAYGYWSVSSDANAPKYILLASGSYDGMLHVWLLGSQQDESLPVASFEDYIRILENSI